MHVSSGDEWVVELEEDYEAGDSKVEPSLVVLVLFNNLSVVGKSAVLLKVLEALQGSSEVVNFSVQEGTLPCVDCVEAKPCWLVRASDAAGTALLRGHVGRALRVPSAGVPGYPRNARGEILVECGALVAGGGDGDALLVGAQGLPSFAELKIGRFTGASLVGEGIIRDLQGMAWTPGAQDLCAKVIEVCLAQHALLSGYVLTLLPCPDQGSKHYGRKLVPAAPAGGGASEKLKVDFGGKIWFRAKPVEVVEGAAVTPLTLPSVVDFPLRGAGVRASADFGAKVTVKRSTTVVDMFYCHTAGVQVRSGAVSPRGWDLPRGSPARRYSLPCPRECLAARRQVSDVRMSGKGATVLHSVGTGATAGLAEGWEEGKVPAIRTRVRVDPGKKTSAEAAVRGACAYKRAFYDENPCSVFVSRMADRLLKQRDSGRRTVTERAEKGLAALALGDVEDEDGQVCFVAACRGDCTQYPCGAARVLRARSAQNALSELGGSSVTVGGTTVAMSSGGASARGGGRGGGKGGGGPAARHPGKSTRTERDDSAQPLGGFGSPDDSGAPPGASMAARRGEAAAALNTKAAVARVGAQVSGYYQQGWEHMSKAESDEVAAALGAAIEVGELPMHAVQSSKDVLAAVSKQLGEVRDTEEGREHEISVLRANRCVIGFRAKFREDSRKSARKARAASSAGHTDSETDTSTLLTAPDKVRLWEEFLGVAQAVYSRAAEFGALSSSEVTRLCAELAAGEVTLEGDGAKFEEVVRAGFAQLETAQCVTVRVEEGEGVPPSYVFEVGAFSGTSSGQAVELGR